MVTVFGMPIVLAVVLLIGFYFITDAHVVNAAEHLSEEQAVRIAFIPELQKDVESIDDRVHGLESGSAAADVKITHLELAVLELKRIHTSEDSKFNELLEILRNMEEN